VCVQNREPHGGEQGHSEPGDFSTVGRATRPLPPHCSQRYTRGCIALEAGLVYRPKPWQKSHGTDTSCHAASALRAARALLAARTCDQKSVPSRRACSRRRAFARLLRWAE
jgi:hypothetical protein